MKKSMQRPKRIVTGICSQKTVEIAPQHQEFEDDKDHVDGKGRLTEGEWRDQAQDIRQARDRRSTQETLDDKRNAGRLDHDGYDQ